MTIGKHQTALCSPVKVMRLNGHHPRALTSLTWDVETWGEIFSPLKSNYTTSILWDGQPGYYCSGNSPAVCSTLVAQQFIMKQWKCVLSVPVSVNSKVAALTAGAVWLAQLVYLLFDSLYALLQWQASVWCSHIWAVTFSLSTLIQCVIVQSQVAHRLANYSDWQAIIISDREVWPRSRIMQMWESEHISVNWRSIYINAWHRRLWILYISLDYKTLE